MAPPLDGIRVLDLTRVLAGPHCGRMLADMGADVIKVEPPAGDLTRFSAPRRHGLATYYVQQNVGKRNVSLDLGTDAGKDVLLDLIEHSDVLLENYRAAVADRLGFGADAALARNPQLIYCSITGYGQTGPWRHRRAYAPVVEAESGVIAKQGRRRSELRKDPFSHGDVYTAMEAAYAIAVALFQRTRTGRGEVIDISMAETMLYVNEHFHDEVWDGETDPQWIRSFRSEDYPVMYLSDGTPVVVSGHPAERGTFELIVNAMGRPDLVDDPRFGDVASRLEHLDELRHLFTEFTATFDDIDQFERHMSHHRLAVGQVRDPGDLAQTEWAAARGVMVQVEDRGGGHIAVPNAPWHLQESDGVGVRGVPKYRGEDNRAVLTDVLGYSAERIAALDSDGALSSHLPASAALTSLDTEVHDEWLDDALPNDVLPDDTSAGDA